MKIGYSVEGSTDRAFIRGLQRRWCPDAVLVEGQFRGKTGLSLRREYPRICEELLAKGVDAMVFLRDGNGEDWREVQQNERAKFPGERLFMAVHGVADRNVECWICSDADFVAQRLAILPADLRVADPKGKFESALGIGFDKKELEIETLVVEAPVPSWLRNPSFEDFYEQARALGAQLGCQMPNLREPAAL